MRTIVYIDGFNFYYGCLRGTPYKWLDFSKLFGLLLPKHDIQAIKYFTAKVGARTGDPGQPVRQQAFLRALGTLPNVEITFGSFLTNTVRLPRANGTGFESVIKTEEKGSDVNLAAHLIADAYENKCDAAIVVSCDSDLLYPVQLVTRLRKVVGLLPPRRNKAVELKRAATFVKPIRPSVLAASQFANHLTDRNGMIHRPLSWYSYQDRISAVLSQNLTTVDDIQLACRVRRDVVESWIAGRAVSDERVVARLHRYLVTLE